MDAIALRIGASPSGKAADFDSAIRRFDPSRPNQLYRAPFARSACAGIHRVASAGYAESTASIGLAATRVRWAQLRAN